MFAGVLVLLGGILFFGSFARMNQPVIPQVMGALRFTLGLWRIVLIMSGIFSLMLWIAIHTDMRWEGWGWYKKFADECHEYDWWGRPVKTSVEPKEFG
jgi:hypothetical protein